MKQIPATWKDDFQLDVILRFYAYNLVTLLFLSVFFLILGNIGEPALLEQYVVLKDYKKQYHNDIKLNNGFTVDVIEKHESGNDFLTL